MAGWNDRYNKFEIYKDLRLKLIKIVVTELLICFKTAIKTN